MRCSSPWVTAQHLLAEGRGALRHVWVKFAWVKLCNQDFGLDLSRIFIFKGQSATEPGYKERSQRVWEDPDLEILVGV